MLKIRTFIWPQRIQDFAAFLLLFIMVPVTYIFDMLIIVPELHPPGGLINVLIWLLGLFVVFNIQGNILACMSVDTSIKATILTPPEQPTLRKLWRFCFDCETLSPPRSWHCPVCRTCILKRDHHCIFTGCCVGHRNQRYFLVFMLYLVLGSGYTTLCTSYYFWWLHADTYFNLSTAAKLIFPALMLSLDISLRNLYLLIYVLNVIAFAFSTVLLIYNAPSILHGAVIYDRLSSKYDLGWRRNLGMVLGKRMKLVWLSPLIHSELPHDGIHWETILQETTKNR